MLVECGKTPIRVLILAAVALLVAVCISLSPVAHGATSFATKPSPTPVARNAGGDIPDTATYLRYKGRSYSIEHVEGWVQARLSQDGVRMSDIDSFERVTLQSQPRHSLTAFVQGPGLTQTKREYQRVVKTSVGTVRLHTGSAVRLVFHARSAPDPVTGKQVTLVIDRYYVPGRTHLAVITLATPVGVDNVDAFRRIAQSFAWKKR
jgi:hypothetical protein